MSQLFLLGGCTRHKGKSLVPAQVNSKIHEGDERFRDGDLSGAAADYLAARNLSISANMPHEFLGARHRDLAEAFARLGRLTESEKEYQAALAELEQAFGRDHQRLGPVLIDLMNVQIKLKHSRAALDAGERAIALRVRALSDKNRSLWNLKHQLYLLNVELKNFEAAEQIKMAHLKAAEDLKDVPGYTGLLWQLGMLYSDWGKLDKAEALVDQCMKRFKVDHNPDRVADSYHYKAHYCYLRKDYATAQNYCKLAVEQKTKLLGVNDPSTQASIQYLAAILVAQEKFAEALAIYQKGLLACGESNQLQCMQCMQSIGNIYYSQKQYAKADEMGRRVVLKAVEDLPTLKEYYTRILKGERTSGERPYATVENICKDERRQVICKALFMMASANFWQGNFERARPLADESLRLQGLVLGAHSMGAQFAKERVYARSVVLLLARIELARGEFEKALAYCSEARLLLRRDEQGLESLWANLNGIEGMCYFKMGMFGLAETRLQKAFQVRDRNQQIVKDEALALAELWQRQKKHAEAKALRASVH